MALPVTLIPAKKQVGETMVLFLTGDGGFNTFSQKLADEYASAGIPVVALNSSKYFWKKTHARIKCCDRCCRVDK